MSGGFDARSLAVVVFLGFVAVSLLLCGLAAADQDDPEHFYAGGGSALGPAGSGLAIAGDYISAATLLSTTGSVALAGFDGILFAVATVASLVLVMRILAEPMRRKGVFTLGDFLADRLGDPTVRRALGITTLVVLAPLLLVQLATAGRVMASMFGLPDGALTSCTVASGALMVCYSAVGGMRGTGYIQIVKVAVVLAAVTLLAGLVLARYGWNPFALFDAAQQGSGAAWVLRAPRTAVRPHLRRDPDLLGFQLTLVLGAACMPHIMMRLHPMRDLWTVRRATVWAAAPVAFLCAGCRRGRSRGVRPARPQDHPGRGPGGRYRAAAGDRRTRPGRRRAAREPAVRVRGLRGVRRPWPRSPASRWPPPPPSPATSRRRPAPVRQSAPTGPRGARSSAPGWPSS